MKKLIITALWLAIAIPAFAQGIADFDYFCWSLNGGTNLINYNVLSVTDGNTGENRSAWFQPLLYVGSFQAAFTYQDVGGGGAEGIAFVIQNDPDGTNALGYDGQGLGYCGITPSIAVLLNLSADAPGGPGGWMLATNGVGVEDLSGDPSGLSYQSTAPLDLTAGNPVNVNISYDGTTLWLSLTDTVSSAVFQTNLPVNIPALVGSNTAWVGITGSDGVTASTQTVGNLTFAPLPVLSSTGTTGTNLTFTWPASIPGYSLQYKTNLASNSWRAVPSAVLQTNGSNQVVITPTAGQHFYRLMTARQLFTGPLTAKGAITLTGRAFVDSFNSSNPNYSSNGLYVASMREAHARVLTDSTNPGAISVGTGMIYGYATTGPGGTVSGAANVTGPINDNANLQFNDVSAPFAYGTGTVPSSGTYQGTNYSYVLSGANYNMPSLTISSSGSSMVIEGNCTLYVNGSMTVEGSGYIYIAPGGSLHMYVNGTANISGGGVVNGSELASQCTIYGMPNCATFTYSANAAYIGTVYAPDAALTLGGNAGGFGSFTAYSISLSSGASAHFDESLAQTYGW